MERNDNLRTLRTVGREGGYVVSGGNRYLDMSSNDYLGLAADTSLQREFLATLTDGRHFIMSNPASRLMTGNSPEYDELEAALAAMYPGRSALAAGSGYAINSALLPAVTSRGDAVIADKLVHASIVDGLRLCECEWLRYNHNDMDHLETLLKKVRAKGVTGDVWVATESLFSMDGDYAPLRDLVALKEKYGFRIYLDEAHAFGVHGAGGAGVASEEGLAGKIDVIVGTLGKAAASVGGFVITEPLVRELLINRMRTTIFSTALPPVTLSWSRFVVEKIHGMNDRRAHLRGLARMMNHGAERASQIVPIMTYENAAAVRLAAELRDAGFWVTAIRHPTVPIGKARVRVSLTAAMAEQDIRNFMEVCKGIL